MNHLKAVAASMVISLCSAIGVASAQGGAPLPTVSATATFDLKVYALSSGQKASDASGVLTYQGKKYPFTVKGIGLHENQVGAAQLVANATVYNLNKASDFAGTFTAVTTGMEATGQSRIRNNKNVLVDLKGWSKGPVIISPEGAIIEFNK
jgi:hypothetical protein